MSSVQSVPSSGVNFNSKAPEGRVRDLHHPWFDSSESLVLNPHITESDKI